MDKKFIIRLVCFIFVSVGVPIIFMIANFDMFQKETKLNMAEFLCIIVLVCMVTVLLKYYLGGMKTKYSYLKQIITGVVKVILPLSIILLAVLWLGNNIEILQEFLIVTIPCEFIGIFINPLPEWSFKNNVDGLTEIINRIFHKEDK